MSKEKLSEWVKRELVASGDDELDSNKERVKNFIRLTENGNVTITNKDLKSRHRVALYFIGAAYARVAGLRKDDSVANKEIEDRLGLPQGTVRPIVKRLREEHSINPVNEGKHKINYARIGTLLEEIEQQAQVLKT